MARGLLYLENIFTTQMQLLDQYGAGVMRANEEAGMTLEKQGEAEKKLTDREEVLRKRLFSEIFPLVFTIAASPAALELAKQVETWDRELHAKFRLEESTLLHPITKEQLAKVDTQVDQLIDQLKMLPKLTPEQAKAEYDAFPEENICP